MLGKSVAVSPPQAPPREYENDPPFDGPDETKVHYADLAFRYSGGGYRRANVSVRKALASVAGGSKRRRRRQAGKLFVTALRKQLVLTWLQELESAGVAARQAFWRAIWKSLDEKYQAQIDEVRAEELLKRLTRIPATQFRQVAGAVVRILDTDGVG